jgi:Domain of unknown function (DUF6602)
MGTTMNKMDGKRVRDFLSQEACALLDVYSQFATLLPSEETEGSAHRGEDGRFVEALVRAFLRRVLPSSLLVSSGFVLRPAVKTGEKGKERRGQKDDHSGQLDIIVFDGTHFPVFHRLEDTVIVPPEGVVAIISIKKHLRDSDIKDECRNLLEAARLCSCRDTDNRPVRGPFLALLAPGSLVEKVKTATEDWVFEQMQSAYEGPAPTFDKVVNYIGAFDWGSVFKARPKPVLAPKTAEFVWFKHSKDDRHLPLQFILTGILSTFYDPTRNSRRRPGFSAFEYGHTKKLGNIPVKELRRR